MTHTNDIISQFNFVEYVMLYLEPEIREVQKALSKLYLTLPYRILSHGKIVYTF